MDRATGGLRRAASTSGGQVMLLQEDVGDDERARRASKALGCRGVTRFDRFGKEEPCSTAAEQMKAETRDNIFDAGPSKDM